MTLWHAVICTWGPCCKDPQLRCCHLQDWACQLQKSGRHKKARFIDEFHQDQASENHLPHRDTQRIKLIHLNQHFSICGSLPLWGSNEPFIGSPKIIRKQRWLFYIVTHNRHKHTYEAGEKGFFTTWGTILKGCSIRTIENHWSN